MDLHQPEREPTRVPAVVESIERYPRPTVFESMRDFWWAIVLVAVLGGLVGTAYGLLREPTYTADARLSVGRVDVATQAIPGYAQAALTLADSYSRAIDAEPVVRDVAQRSGLSQRKVAESISASPIPESPIVRVFATSDSGDPAVSLANTTSRSLMDYVRRLNEFNPDSKELLQRFQRASQKYRQALVEQGAGGGARVQAEVDSAQLQMQTAGDLYRSSQAGRSSPNTLQPLAFAASASSDFNPALLRAIFAGLMFGLVIGAGLSVFLANRY